MKIIQLLVIVLFSALLAACASSESGSVYSRDEARKVQTVRTGVVESVRQVKIEGTKTPIGAAAGAAVGGIAGSSVGGNSNTSAAVAVIGAVVGGIAGAAAEEGLTRENGLEITVKLDGGGLIAIVQEADDPFNAGDKVRLIELDGTTRVSH